jgi:Tfp pilus assembly protein PilZ
MRSTDRFPLDDVLCNVDGASLPVANLSVGGFFVTSEAPLPIAQSVAFELVFPGGWRLSAVGRVAWVNGPGAARTPGLPTGFGITITKIAFPDKLALVARLRALSATAAPTPRLRHTRPAKSPRPRRPR